MKWIDALLFLVFLSACAGTPASPTLAPSPSPSPAPVEPAPAATAASNLDCQPGEVFAPTLPAVIPARNELDETSGLHMTGDVQQIDLQTYRLKVSGKVDHPLSLTYAELRCLPKVAATADLVCPGFFQDRAAWAGVPILEVLKLAGVKPGLRKVTLVSADGYRQAIPAEDALDPKNFLAYEMESQPLPILHGFPLRAVFPGQVGGWWVKWLVELIAA
jgi:DMSO/TMAO reductase YedYZ molybdopterin-dependent catalytic subunit